jgi:hypothetical protein
MAGESRRANLVPLHRAQESASSDCTVRGLPLNRWPAAANEVINVPDNYWNDEETDLYLTDDFGENYELI